MEWIMQYYSMAFHICAFSELSELIGYLQQIYGSGFLTDHVDKKQR